MKNPKSAEAWAHLQYILVLFAMQSAVLLTSTPNKYLICAAFRITTIEIATIPPRVPATIEPILAPERPCKRTACGVVIEGETEDVDAVSVADVGDDVLVSGDSDDDAEVDVGDNVNKEVDVVSDDDDNREVDVVGDNDKEVDVVVIVVKRVIAVENWGSA